MVSSGNIYKLLLCTQFEWFHVSKLFIFQGVLNSGEKLQCLKTNSASTHLSTSGATDMQCSFSSTVSSCGMNFTDTFLMQKPSVKFAWHVLKDIHCSSATSLMTILSPLSPNYALSLSLLYFYLMNVVHTAHNLLPQIYEWSPSLGQQNYSKTYI